MRRGFVILPLLILLLISPSKPAAGENLSLNTIRWMLGVWVYVADETTTQEIWTDTGDGIFKGTGTVVSASDQTLHSRESLLLVEMSGAVFYLAKVDGNPLPVPFTLVRASPGFAVFENTAHDFPNRLEYRLGEGGRLDVTVSGGAERSFVIPFRRVNR